MKVFRLLPAVALLAAASAARAEGPPGPQEDLQDELAKASLRVSKALKENEDALARIARGDGGDAKSVAIDLPKNETKTSSPSSSPTGGGGSSGGGGNSGGGGTSGGEGGAGGALRGSEEHGKGVIDGIDEILRVARKMSQQMGPGSGGGKSSRPKGGEDGDEKDESGKPKNDKKGPEEKADPLKDNKPDGDGKPQGGEKSKSQPNKSGAVPPSTPRRPTEKELKGIFLAKLPDKVREAVENGDFDQVPEKYRDLIREWTRALSAADKAEAGAGDDSK